MASASAGAQLRALLVANARFWRSVAPVAHAELARWRELAETIRDEGLRELALAKLEHEAFNAEVAATLATLAPAPRRAAVVKAIVALEVLFDYLDGRTEALFLERAPDGSGGEGEVALRQGRALSRALCSAITGQAPQLTGADREYVDALWRHAHEHAAGLPGLAAVAPAALTAASRCAEAQLRLHAATALGDEQLQRWAREACRGSGLGWREYVGGGAASVLAMHALIATAARARASAAQAQALDHAYVAIGAVITTLDGLVDESGDGGGAVGYIRLHETREQLERRLAALVGEALRRAAQLPDGAHHAMTLAGAAAYYTTHAGAAEAQNRAISAAVRRQLAPTIWPTLAVLVSWRAAKRARGAIGAPVAVARRRVRRPASAPRGPRGGGEREAGEG